MGCARWEGDRCSVGDGGCGKAVGECLNCCKSEKDDKTKTDEI